MQNLMYNYEEEKLKLNELGQKSLEQGIPLSDNEAIKPRAVLLMKLFIRCIKTKADI